MNRILIVVVLILTSVLLIVGCSPSPTPTPVPQLALEIDLLGEKNEFFVDKEGMLKSKVEVSSANGSISLSLDKGTVVLDRDGKPLQLIQAVIDPNPPPPPEDAYIIGSTYDLRPQGATFTPQLGLTLSYDPGEIPEGVRENELYVAYHNDSGWYFLRYKKVDTKAHSVATQVYHFTSFAILGPKELGPPSTPTPAQGTQVGNLAPDFELQSLDGQSVSLSDLQGKPVLLNFWATWCRPCVSEMPYLQEIHDEWAGKGLALLAVNIGDSSTKVKEFMQNHNLSLPVLLDTDQDVALEYNIRAIPTTFLIDKDGIIQEMKVGAFSSKAEIEETLSKIIP